MRYQSTTGLSADQIQELVVRIYHILGSRPRRVDRPRSLGLYQSVVLALILVRRNISQTLAADMFGVSRPTASRVYRTFPPLIEEALCMHGPQLVEALQKRVVLIDGTLIPTGNRAGHRQNYSGKRRRGGLGVQVAADTDGSLLGVSEPYIGSMRDRRALTETGWEEILQGMSAVGDAGYQGTELVTPRKKPPGGDLSDMDKEANQTISSIRSAVERAIGHLKNWKILATGYRGRLGELPNVLCVVVRLEFYRLGW